MKKLWRKVWCGLRGHRLVVMNVPAEGVVVLACRCGHARYTIDLTRMILRQESDTEETP